MSTCMSLGSVARLAVDGSGSGPRTFGASSERYDFLYETLTKKQRRVGNGTIKGDLSDWVERNVEGASLVSGVIAFQGTPTWFKNWAPRIIGPDSGSTDADAQTIYAPGTSLPSFDVMIDKEGRVFQYVDCYVNQCMIRGTNTPGGDDPEVIDVVVQIIGKYRENDATWAALIPDLGVTDNELPDVMGLSTLTIDSVSYPFDRFSLSIDHGLLPKWRNSLTISCIRPTKRSVRLQTSNPFTDTTYGALHETLSAPVAGSLKFTRGDARTTFTFGTLDNMGEDPAVRGKTEVPHVLDFAALRDQSTSTPEITTSTLLAV